MRRARIALVADLIWAGVIGGGVLLRVPPIIPPYRIDFFKPNSQTVARFDASGRIGPYRDRSIRPVARV